MTVPMVRFEAVDGDRRVLFEFPDPATTERAAGHGALFRAVAEQMFRSGRAERARAAGRVVGEAGTGDGPAVETTRGTSLTTESVFGSTGIAFGPGSRGMGGPHGPVYIEDLGGPTVVPVEGPFPSPQDLGWPADPDETCGHWSAWHDDGAAICCDLPLGHDGEHWSRSQGFGWTHAEAIDRCISCNREGETCSWHGPEEREAPAAPVLVPDPSREAGDAGRAAGAAVVSIAVRAAELAAKPATQGPPPPIAPDRPAIVNRGTEPEAPQGRIKPKAERSAPASITPPKPAAPKPTPAPPAPGERLTPEQRMDRFVETYKAGAGKPADKRVEAAAKAAGLATTSGAAYLRRARELGLIPDPLGGLARSAGPITGGVA